MAFHHTLSPLAASLLRFSGSAAVTAFLLSAVASGQQRDDMLFSVSWRGPLVGAGGVSAGDILVPDGGQTEYQASTPSVAMQAWQLGVAARAGCSPGDFLPCGDELDALSLGHDIRLPANRSLALSVFFSVDSHAVGAGVPLALPSVTTEAMFDDQGADVFSTRWRGDLRPLDALATGRNHLKIDGDGIGAGGGSGFQQYGSGLREHNPEAGRWPSTRYDRGDDLDALNLGQSAHTLGASKIYLSLEGGIVDLMDPAGTPPVLSSAELAGFSGADILASSIAGGLSVYVGATKLGLDPDLDDVDAILIAENGEPGYQRSAGAFSWTTDGSDMVVFSVRRGSAIVGQYDSWLGLPICEGDLLAPPRMHGQTPGIVVTAESLGLRSTRTSDVAHGDDLDGATTDIDALEFLDCNENGIEDRLDIVDKTSYDFNENGIPDECEYDGEDFCTCPLGASTTCTNAEPYRGCGNQTGEGARLACIGPADIDDAFGFTVYGLPPSATSFLILGNSGLLPAQSGNGIACMAGYTLVGGTQSASSSGTLAYLPGILAGLGTLAPAAGETGLFQVWYRDAPFGSCTGKTNWSNGVALTL